MLRKVYPWLLPLAVSLVLVLAFATAERVRRTTPEGKFNRIHLGMEVEHVTEILGTPHALTSEEDALFWVVGDVFVEVTFDHNKVSAKTLSWGF